jgi:hypothetical protein
LARYAYEWKNTQHGKRLFRRPLAGARRDTPAAPAIDYGSLKKPELVALADKRRIDSSGTKADILGRLEAADGR